MEGDLDVRIVLQEAILFFVVGVTPGGAASKVLLEGFYNGGRTGGLEVEGRDVAS